MSGVPNDERRPSGGRRVVEQTEQVRQNGTRRVGQSVHATPTHVVAAASAVAA